MTVVFTPDFDVKVVELAVVVQGIFDRSHSGGGFFVHQRVKDGRHFSRRAKQVFFRAVTGDVLDEFQQGRGFRPLLRAELVALAVGKQRRQAQGFVHAVQGVAHPFEVFVQGDGNVIAEGGFRGIERLFHPLPVLVQLGFVQLGDARPQPNAGGAPVFLFIRRSAFVMPDEECRQFLQGLCGFFLGIVTGALAAAAAVIADFVLRDFLTAQSFPFCRGGVGIKIGVFPRRSGFFLLYCQLIRFVLGICAFLLPSVLSSADGLCRLVVFGVQAANPCGGIFRRLYQLPVFGGIQRLQAFALRRFTAFSGGNLRAVVTDVCDSVFGIARKRRDLVVQGVEFVVMALAGVKGTLSFANLRGSRCTGIGGYRPDFKVGGVDGFFAHDFAIGKQHTVLGHGKAVLKAFVLTRRAAEIAQFGAQVMHRSFVVAADEFGDATR